MAMRGDRIQVILDGATHWATVLRITKRGNYEILVEGEKALRVVEGQNQAPARRPRRKAATTPAAEPVAAAAAVADAPQATKKSWPMVRGKRRVAPGDWVRICETGELFQVGRVRGMGLTTQVALAGRGPGWKEGQRLEKVTLPEPPKSGLLTRNLLVIDWPSLFGEAFAGAGAAQEGDHDLDLAWAGQADGTERAKPILGPKALRHALERVFLLPDGVPTFVAESKTAAYFLAQAQGTQNLYVLAAEADVEEGRTLTRRNWLGRLLADAVPLKQAVVIRPDIHFGFAPKGTHPEKGLVLARATQLPYAAQRVPISAVLLCRSGAVAPPWLDQAFLRQAEAFHPAPKDLGLRSRVSREKAKKEAGEATA